MADETLDDMLLEAAGRPKATHWTGKAGRSRRTKPDPPRCSQISDRSKVPHRKMSEFLDNNGKASLRHRQMQGKILQPRERDVEPPSFRMRSSMRDPPGALRTAKDNALNELVARRMESQDVDLKRKHRDASASSRETDRQVQTRISHKSRHSVSDCEGDYGEDTSGGEDSSSSDEDDLRKEEPEAGVEDIKSITISRSKLAEWFREPFFEDAVAGCFVRIGIGLSRSGQRTYRVCLVKNVDARDPEKQYLFENRRTYKYLNCVWGDEISSARWQMVTASDQPPTEKEILEMKREVGRCGGRKLTKASVEKKREALAKVNTFVYDAATVKQMLQEKKLATARPSNIAVEKYRITEELGLAERKGDHGPAVDRLKARLRELEAFSIQINNSKDAKALALTEMNRRNKFENFKNASDAKPVSTDAKVGEAGYDPFSRRWTRSQNYYKTEAPHEEKESEDKCSPVEAEPAAPLSHQKLGIKELVPVDEATKLFSLHDFDLRISLAPLTQMGGISRHGAHIAYMARKQNLEASLGAQVEKRDGRRHNYLTVNDYKRRQHLL